MLLFVIKILIVLSTPFLFSKPVNAATINLSPSSSINSAIQKAGSGDTISLSPGTYNEEVNLNKSVSIISSGNGQVWIDGGCNNKTGITITASNTFVKGLGVKKTKEQGIIVRNTSTSNVTIENNTVQDYNCQDQGEQYAAGIASWYGGSNIKVVNNKITRRVEMGGNLRGQGNGIWFKSNNDNPSGGGHTISGNTILGGFDGIGGEEEGSDRGSFDKNSTIENNIIKNCFDDGIQVEGGDVDIKVKNNTIEGCGIGIAFAPNKIGPLYIESNSIIADLGARGVHGQLACYKLGRGGNGTTYLTGNYCSIPGGSDGGDGLKQTNRGLSPIVSKNNTFSTSRYIFELSDTPPPGSSFDGDCFYTSDSGRFIKWGGKRFTDLNAFKSGTGQEANALSLQNCPKTPSPVQITNPTPVVVTPPQPPSSVIPSTTPSPKPSVPTGPTRVEELKKQVEELEKQVIEAEKKQESLTSTLNSILQWLKNLNPFKIL